MKPKIGLITLGVADLQRSLSFYRDGLGLPTENYDPEQDVVFFRLEGNQIGSITILNLHSFAVGPSEY